MKVTNGYYRELMKANGSLEAVGFREHDRQEEELLERRYERCKREYDKEKAKLNELYTQKEQARREALQCLQNRCGDICRLGGSLLAILDKYLTDQKKRKGKKRKFPHPLPPQQARPPISPCDCCQPFMRNATTNSLKPFPKRISTPE